MNLTNNLSDKLIGIIGLGNMGISILECLLKSGHDKGKIICSRRDAKKLDEIAERYGIMATIDNKKLVIASDIIITAVKPGGIAALCEEMHEVAGDGKLYINAEAIIQLSTYEKILGNQNKLIRIMPNLGIRNKTGAVLYSMNANCSEYEKAALEYIFRGNYIAKIREENMAAATLLSCHLGNTCMDMAKDIDAFASMGMPYETALNYVISNLRTAADMLESGKSPTEIFYGVATPNGITWQINEYREQSGSYASRKESWDAGLKRYMELEYVLNESQI